MPRALWVLKCLEIRGWARRFLRLLKRPAGILILICYFFMFGPAMLSGLVMERDELRIPAEWIARGAPLGLALMCLIVLLRPGMRFSFNFKPAEIDVLFTGPYTRRHLVTYKLVGNISGALFISLIMFAASLAFIPSRLPMFLGMFLGFLFIFLFTTLYGTILQAVSSRIQFVGYAISGALVFAVGYSMYAVFSDLASAVGMTPAPALLFDAVFNHPVVKSISLPFIPFANVMAGGPVLALSTWAAVCVAMIALEYVLIIWLDADYMESAMTRSARQYEALERFKRGQVMSYRTSTRRRNWTLPSLPRWGGFGPIAWRQLLGATHNWGRVILLLYIVCVAGGLALPLTEHREKLGNLSLPLLLGFLAYISILVTNLFRFDFRSEIDTMDSLKTLPVSAATVSLAQITAPVVLMCSIYLAFGLGVAIAVRRPEIVLIVAVLAPSFAALLMAVENLTFLIWPARLGHQGNLDAKSLGRGFISFLVKIVILAPACGIAVAVAFANRWLFDSWAPGYFFASVILGLEAALVVPFVASAYARFDPSIDTPP
ncbi:MAG: putative ABC exporter domain-containing protein [Candidatus Hydrogenedentes bacterium]|nr:putative ABC exporter domain-containing protein [Candidatus Hydrogenedentota bacterium]